MNYTNKNCYETLFLTKDFRAFLGKYLFCWIIAKLFQIDKLKRLILTILLSRTIHEARHGTSSLSTAQENRRFGRERKVFFQFFITIIWLAVFDIPFITLGYLDKPSRWLGYFVTIAYIINCSVNGWVYLILNKTIQKEIKIWISELPKWYRCKCIQVHYGNGTDGTDSSCSQLKGNCGNDVKQQEMKSNIFLEV